MNRNSVAGNLPDTLLHTPAWHKTHPLQGRIRPHFRLYPAPCRGISPKSVGRRWLDGAAGVAYTVTIS
jgi:hypothetical protein